MNLDIWKTRIKTINENLSDRYIELDPKGYFIIKVDLLRKRIFVEHYLNKIDKKGYAVDPNTNEPISCDSNKLRNYNTIFTGETAKELGIQITEKRNDLISKFDHALYLGRELQKAEECLLQNISYVQD